MALEASRSEASALKVALLHSNDKYEETRKAYDSLLDQLKEEVKGFASLCWQRFIVRAPGRHAEQAGQRKVSQRA